MALNDKLVPILVLFIIISIALGSASLLVFKSTTSSIEELRERIAEELSSVKSNQQSIQSELARLSILVSQLEDKISVLTGYPLTLEDALNRTIVITSEPSRVVSLAPSITEIIFAINASDKLVGVDDYSNYPPILNKLVEEGRIRRVGGFANPSIETILSLNPDIVFTTTGVQAKIALHLSRLGITTIALPEGSLQDIYYSILVLGKLLNRYEEAADLVRSISTNVTLVVTTVSDYDKPNVLFIVWPEPLFTIGSSSFINELITLAGGKNVFDDVEQAYPMVSPEEVVARDPQVIIISGTDMFKSVSEFLEWARSKPGWSNITAIREGRVYILAGEYNDVIVRPGPRIAIGLEVLAAILHPQAFNITSLPEVVAPETFALPALR